MSELSLGAKEFKSVINYNHSSYSIKDVQGNYNWSSVSVSIHLIAYTSN